MPNKQLDSLKEILIVTSIAGVGLALGAPTPGLIGIIGSMAGSIGANLQSGYVQRLFFSNNGGIHNHDIQRAMARAAFNALQNLEDKYLEKIRGPEAHSRRKMESLKDFFNRFNEHLKNLSFEAVASSTNKQDFKENYICQTSEKITENIQKNIPQGLTDDQSEFITFFFEDDNFYKEIQNFFYEELKVDDRACRAFNILLQESIKMDTGELKIKVNTLLEINKDILSRIPFKDKLYKQKQELINEILDSYTSSVIPEYTILLKEFVTKNREEELMKAITYLKNHRILLISGIGGVGKTTLARALIETRSANVPLPFWFDFDNRVNATLGDVLENLASYLKAPDIIRFKIEGEGKDAGQNDINKLIGELQRREQLWLVFDNLESILKDDRKFRDESMGLLFASLRGSTHNAKIIVTSRILPLLNNGESLIDALDEKQEVKGLKLDFAVDFLVKNGLERVERETLEKLATGVEGHPLALSLLIGLVKEIGVSDTLADLSTYKKNTKDTIIIARKLFGRLAGDEKELLENISVFRKPETKTAIEKMFTEKTPKDAIRKLINKSLLETDRKGNYWLHPLIREFSYDDLRNKKEIHQLAFSYYQSLKLPEKRTKKDDVQTLIEAHYHAYMAKEYDEAVHIIFDNNMDEYLNRWGDYRTLVELYVRVLPKDHFRDEPLISDTKIQISILGKLGIAYLNLSDFKKSIEYHDKALNIAQEIKDRPSEGLWLGELGKAYFYLGDFQKSIEYFFKALNIAQEIEDRPSESLWLGYLGLIYYHQVELEKAIDYCEKALKIVRKIGDRKGESTESTLLGYVGLAYTYLGDMNKAIEYQKAALKIAQEIGDRRNEGIHNGNVGIPYYYQNDVNKALEYFKKALKIAQEIGDRRNESMWLGWLGLAHRFLGSLQQSTEDFEKALKIAQEIGDRRNESTWLSYLSTNYRKFEQPEKAQEYFEKALKIDTEIGAEENESM